jgi:hypothetical protein
MQLLLHLADNGPVWFKKGLIPGQGVTTFSGFGIAQGQEQCFPM